MWLEITDKVERFSEVPIDTLEDGVYRLDGLQLLFCDFTSLRALMAARKLPSLAFQVEYSINWDVFLALLI